jgi:hypothetical protein
LLRQGAIASPSIGSRSASLARAVAVIRPAILALTHMWNGPGCKIFLWLNKG